MNIILLLVGTEYHVYLVRGKELYQSQLNVSLLVCIYKFVQACKGASCRVDTLRVLYPPSTYA